MDRLSSRHAAHAEPPHAGTGPVVGRRVTGGKALPSEVLEQILARTEGVPLFTEELTKTVLESGLLDDVGDRYVLDRPLPPLAIPATLHDSLMARLDRLASVKEVAQIGACIGREFDYELLAAVVSLPEAELLQRSITLSPRSLSSAAAFPRQPPTSSSTRWCATQLMKACLESVGRSCTPA